MPSFSWVVKPYFWLLAALPVTANAALCAATCVILPYDLSQNSAHPLQGWVFVGTVLELVDDLVAETVKFEESVTVSLITVKTSAPTPPTSRVMVLVEPALVVVVIEVSVDPDAETKPDVLVADI